MTIIAKEDNFGAIRGVVTRSLTKDSGLAAADLMGGTFVVKGANMAVSVVASAADVARADGVVVHPKVKLNRGVEVADPVTSVPQQFEYITDDDVVYLMQGEIYCACETDMVPGADVYVRHTASAAGTFPGSVRSDDDGGNAALVPGVRVARASVGIEPCLLTVNLPA